MHVFVSVVVAVPLSSFYPYGTDTSDSTVGPTDDGGAALSLSQSFIFFGISYDLIYVSDDSCPINSKRSQQPW